jgi:hypothetical protein
MDTWWTADLPTWLEAIGTIGAFGTGGVVLLRELNRDREREIASERQQAGAVAAWATHVESTGIPVPRVHTVLVLSNGSQEPVYHVEIEYKSGTDIQTDRIDFLPPGRQERELPVSLQETWVKSEERWIKRESPSETTKNPHTAEWKFGVIINFIDAGGRSWRRESDGSLHRQ